MIDLILGVLILLAILFYLYYIIRKWLLKLAAQKHPNKQQSTNSQDMKIPSNMQLTQAYFENKALCVSNGMNAMQHKAYLKDNKKIYPEDIYTNPKLLAKAFIESEDLALKYQFQGQLYPLVHYRIDKILKSSFKGFTEETIIHFFFHCFRLGKAWRPKPAFYPLYQKAVSEALLLKNEANYLVFSHSKENLYLWFGITKQFDFNKVLFVPYDDYCNKLAFSTLANSYTAFPNMRKKKERFREYLENEELVKQCRTLVQEIFDTTEDDNPHFSFTQAASLLLLLLGLKTVDKELLFKLHTQNLNRRKVWLLGSFYKDFQETADHKLLLTDLYNTYSKTWIDEYNQS